MSSETFFDVLWLSRPAVKDAGMVNISLISATLEEDADDSVLPEY